MCVCVAWSRTCLKWVLVKEFFKLGIPIMVRTLFYNVHQRITVYVCICVYIVVVVVSHRLRKCCMIGCLRWCCFMWRRWCMATTCSSLQLVSWSTFCSFSHRCCYGMSFLKNNIYIYIYIYIYDFI